ncbi:MAG: ankyrin repeat domain-containing protein [Endozoicomonadaceae bacterium]|nr:ankyrin repeat domain-containing protein [Endozoicomonadaceae bacterium]
MKKVIDYSLFLISNCLSANRKIIKSVLALSLLCFCSVSFAIEDDVIISIIREGNVATVDALIQNGALEVNQTLQIEEAEFFSSEKTNHSYTPLMVAAKSGLINMVEYFIQRGAVIDQQIDGMTALMYAVLREHKDVAIFLLEKGANAHLKDDWNFTTLMYATLGINKPAVISLHQYLTLYAPNNPNFNPLIEAAFRCDIETIKRLMDDKIDSDMQGIMSLMGLARTNKIQIIKFLIDLGVDINAQNDNNTTALICAVTAQNAEAVDLLLYNNANVNIQDGDGNTALIYAATGETKEITQLLLAKQANTDIQNKEGNTALICAVRLQRTETVKLLLASGANIYIKNNDGDTAESCAGKTKNSEVIQLLVEYDSSVRRQNQSSHTSCAPVIISPEGFNVAGPLGNLYNDSDMSQPLSQYPLTHATENDRQDPTAQVSLVQYLQSLQM